MSFNAFLILWIVIVSGYRRNSISAVSGQSHGKPNIIILIADDLGWNDLSFHGSPQIPTPNLDYLAQNGIILNNYYVTPLCSPSRGALMTGLYPIHTGLQHDVIYVTQPWGLSLNKTLLPLHLRKLGYETHAVGKWHLGFFHKEYTPTYRGFNSHYGYWGGKEDYFDHTQQMGQMWGLDFRHNMEPVNDSLGKYSTLLFADQASKIIQKHNNSKPLFLYVAYQAVHSANSYDTLQAPPEYINRFPHIKNKNRKIFAALIQEFRPLHVSTFCASKIRGSKAYVISKKNIPVAAGDESQPFCHLLEGNGYTILKRPKATGMVSAMDDSVKTVVEALNSRNMLQNSIIVFSTDNGGPAAGFNDNAASNWPLRGVKSTLWEGGVRGISFIWSPLLKKTGRVSMDLMHITDWLPTLYYAAGGNVSDLHDLDGINVWDSLSYNKPSPRSEVLLNIDPINKVSALRVGNYKIIQGTVYDGKWDGWYGPSGRENSTDENTFESKFSNQTGFRSELLCGHKPENATACFPGDTPCLFNVDKDPCELNNLASKRPDILKSMLNRLSFYEKSSIPPANKPADPRCDPKYHGYVWTNWMDYV